MRAIRIHAFGGTDVLKLEDIRVPVIADNEVLIKVHASSVNPVDMKIIAGEAQQKFPTQFPLTIGWDASGTIEQAGPGVQGFHVGDEVYGRPFPTQNGAFAEYVLMPAHEVQLKPKSVSHEVAAAVPLAGLTAWQGLFTHGNLEAGQKVLIHGASGGVGTFAVQFAKWKGAHVIATASAGNLDFVKQLGAHEAIDYKQDNFEQHVHDADVVLDLVGGETQLRSINVTRAGGRVVTTVMPQHQQQAESKGVQLKSFTAQSDPHDLQQIANLIDAGQVQPVIAQTFVLEAAAEAEQLGKEGHVRGKIVVKIL